MNAFRGHSDIYSSIIYLSQYGVVMLISLISTIASMTSSSLCSFLISHMR